MKILLKRTGKDYVYVCPYRSSEDAEIRDGLDSGKYVIAKILSDFDVSIHRSFSYSDSASEFVKKQMHSSYLNEKITQQDYSYEELKNLLDAMPDINSRYKLLLESNFEVNEDDLKFARNPEIMKGPNENSYHGRIVKYKEKSVFLQKDLKIIDWNEYKNSQQTTQVTSENPVSITPENPVSITSSLEQNESITPETLQLLDKLDEIEKQKSSTANNKGYNEFMSAIADFDEDAAFKSIEEDLRKLDLGGSIEDAMNAIDNEIEAKSIKSDKDETDNLVQLGNDKVTVTVKWNGTTYKKTFKSENVAERNAKSIATIMSDEPNSLIDILEGPTSIYRKVEVQ